MGEGVDTMIEEVEKNRRQYMNLPIDSKDYDFPFFVSFVLQVCPAPHFPICPRPADPKPRLPKPEILTTYSLQVPQCFHNNATGTSLPLPCSSVLSIARAWLLSNIAHSIR